MAFQRSLLRTVLPTGQLFESSHARDRRNLFLYKRPLRAQATSIGHKSFARYWIFVPFLPRVLCFFHTILRHVIYRGLIEFWHFRRERKLRLLKTSSHSLPDPWSASLALHVRGRSFLCPTGYACGTDLVFRD